MDVFLINAKNENRLDFIKELSQNLSKEKSVLILSFKRNKDKNIEDLFDMAGMITYDICDYFLNIAGLEKIIVENDENLDFAISPLLEEKYEVKEEDIKKLLKNLNSYDYIVIDSLDKSLLNNQKEINIINENEISNKITSDYYFIETLNKDFDPRNNRAEIIEKSSKYLGLKIPSNSYEKIIENLLEDKNEEIEKLGFFEKLKKKFTK